MINKIKSFFCTQKNTKKSKTTSTSDAAIEMCVQTFQICKPMYVCACVNVYLILERRDTIKDESTHELMEH